MIRVRLLAGFLAIAALAFAGIHLVYSETPPPPEVPAAPAINSDAASLPLGSSSCSGCHGKSAPDPLPSSAYGTEKDFDRWQSSYTVWKGHDRHARAYAVLLDERSERIIRNLSGGHAHTRAHEDARCLACHTNPTIAARTDPPARALHMEGVGCESCHANARPWVAEHTTGRRDKMTQLNSIDVRAKTCAGCHVGAPATGDIPVRDVNHDLIAAGHPRLNFDYSTYVRALPPHWLERSREVEGRRPATLDQSLKEWAGAQGAVAEAGLVLLSDRVSRGPWPELAEFNCSACHHDLPGTTRAKRGKPGTMQWNEPLAMHLFELPNAKRLRETLHQKPLAKDAIHQLATSAAQDPLLKVGSVHWSDPHFEKVLIRVLGQLTFTRWDEACRGYYALTTMEAAGISLNREKLAELRSLLALPRTVNGERFNTPKDYDPKRVADLIAAICSQASGKQK